MTDPVADLSAPSEPVLATLDEPIAQLELALAPEDAPILLKRPGIERDGSSRAAAIVWLDDAEGGLLTQDRIVGREGRRCWIEALAPGQDVEWPACAPAPILAAAPSLAALDPPAPSAAAPVAAFDGRRRRLRHGGIVIELSQGQLRGLVEHRPTCRLQLRGPARELAQAVPELAELRLSVPRATLAREALAVVKGGRLPARHLGAPSLNGDKTLTEGFGYIVGALLDTFLYWIDEYRRVASDEAVHQARVAIRRLRSALSIYKRVVPCPELTEAAGALKECARRLGAARDWDVFLAETGTRLESATGADRRVAALLRNARRRREAVHADLSAFLASPEFRRLELLLGIAAALRPWERDADPSTLLAPTAGFAAAALDKRMKSVRRRGKTLEALAAEELHELRKDCKRLRYTAEFFAAAFSGRDVRAFVKRLSALQDELGLLNDNAVAAGLMRQLGRGGTGYAGGLVEGWATAMSAPAHGRLAKKWRRFRATSRFWRQPV